MRLVILLFASVSLFAQQPTAKIEVAPENTSVLSATVGLHEQTCRQARTASQRRACRSGY